MDCCSAGDWLQEHTDLREELLKEFNAADLRNLAIEMQRRIEASGRPVPQPKLSDRALQRLERERTKRLRIEEQLRLDGKEVTPEVRSKVKFMA